MRWVIRFIGLVLLIGVIVVVGVVMLPKDRIAQIAADQLSRATGRSVEITGDLGITLWPQLGVRADGLRIGNPDWATGEALFRSGAAALSVDAAALLRREIEVTEIRAEAPVIHLEERADGLVNWRLSPDLGTPAPEGGPSAGANRTPFSIARVDITDATVIYAAEGAALQRFDGIHLALDWPDQAGPAQINGRFELSERPIEIAARVGQFARFLEGTVQDVDLETALGASRVRFKGQASLGGELGGNLAVAAPATADLFSRFGANSVDLPQGLGRSLDLTAEVTFTAAQQLALRNVTADLGGNTLRAAADIDFQEKPQVTATLDVGNLDLSALTSSENAEAEEDRAVKTWPTDPIDASGLAAFDGQIALNAQSVDLGSLTLGPTKARLTNTRSRLVFELNDVAAYEGQFQGEFVINNRNGLSVGGGLRAVGVQMKPLLTDLAGLERFSGKGDAQVKFLGVGGSVDAIMRSLSGDGGIAVGRGAIEGIDLDDLLGSFDTDGGTTVFDQLVAQFTMAGGVVQNDDLSMLLPNFETTGAGQIDLGAQTLDYTVTPKALRLNKESGLAVPVRIVGPWARPRIQPDLKAAIDLNFREERERAEERVKQEIERKLQDEIGVTREEGQSLEDAVKDRAEDALKRELLRLFD
ncbi:MAG: AsmA family protein [Pseudomonadota bacterium]